jgi:hypothetical protein
VFFLGTAMPRCSSARGFFFGHLPTMPPLLLQWRTAASFARPSRLPWLYPRRAAFGTLWTRQRTRWPHLFEFWGHDCTSAVPVLLANARCAMDRMQVEHALLAPAGRHAVALVVKEAAGAPRPPPVRDRAGVGEPKPTSLAAAGLNVSVQLVDATYGALLVKIQEGGDLCFVPPNAPSPSCCRAPPTLASWRASAIAWWTLWLWAPCSASPPPSVVRPCNGPGWPDAPCGSHAKLAASATVVACEIGLGRAPGLAGLLGSATQALSNPLQPGLLSKVGVGSGACARLACGPANLSRWLVLAPGPKGTGI